MHPTDFKRRILLTLAGHSPAIITETLYALTQTQQPAYIPTEIHVLTTSSGKAKVLETLLGERNILQQFCDEYAVPLPQFDETFIHVIQDKDGQALADLQTEADNEAAADFIMAVVQQLTNDQVSSLHTSIAGGRKTMSYYLGYAMSLFGRMQDRLSHVLIDETKNHRDFFYPTSTDNIAVILADIPFVRLREGWGFAENLTEGKHSFNQVIALVQRQFNDNRVTLIKGELYAHNFKVEHAKFKQTSLAVYVWLLQRHHAGQNFIRFKSKDSDGNLEYSEALLNTYRQLHKDKGINKMEAAIETCGLNADYLRPHINHCNNALKSCLNKAAKHYLIQTTEQEDYLSYGLPESLSPEHIDLPF